VAEGEEVSDDVQVGARVRLLPADSWINPLRKFAAEQRPATIKSLPAPKHGRRYYWLEFDVKRRGARPYRASFDRGDFEVIQDATTEPSP